MAKKIFIGFTVLIGSISFVWFFAFAQEGAFGVRDLGVEHVGLLPSNPFYFLKEFRRDVRKFFTFKELRRLEVDVEIANEKAAEVKKLQEINPNNESPQKALANYEAHLRVVKTRLEGLRGTSKSTSIDQALERLVETSVKHYVVLHTVSGSGTVRSLLAEVITLVAQRFDSPEQFADRLMRAIAKVPQGELNELRLAELFEQLDDGLLPALRQLLLPMHDELLAAFSGRLESLLLVAPLDAVFASWSGDQLTLLRLLDEVRERIVNQDLKTALNLFRQKLLERIEEERGILKEDAQSAMDTAQTLLAQLEQALTRTSAIPQSIKQLLEHAKFASAQAILLFKEDNYSGAYGQATASAAAARNAFAQLYFRAQDYQQTLTRVKNRFDRLSQEVRSLDLKPTDAPRLFTLLGEAEKRIVEAATQLQIKGIRTIQSLLAAIEELIRVVR